MLRPSTLAALLLVVLWLPATLHCQLEGLGLDAIFACADRPDETAHSDEGACADDACQTIESGQFALSQSKIAPAVLPSPACLCATCFLHIAPPVREPENPVFCPAEPLPLQRTWQFARRAALPARAPDTLKV